MVSSVKRVSDLLPQVVSTFSHHTIASPDRLWIPSFIHSSMKSVIIRRDEVKSNVGCTSLLVAWTLFMVTPGVLDTMLASSYVLHSACPKGSIQIISKESAFFMAEFLFILQWGRLSDRYGRKPVIITGLLGVFISIVSFGFSRTFVTLVISRCLAGVMNGNVGVIKSTIGELTDETNVQDAFQYMPLCWPVGEAIG